MKRKATCHCGQLTVTADGDPLRVVMCHCEACQRRTGSSFNLGAVFQPASVQPAGESNIYRRTGELGTEIAFHFCPTCGSNVYWHFGDLLVVAAGCFADQSLPAPSVSLYGRHRHPWLPHIDVDVAFSGNRDSDPES